VSTEIDLRFQLKARNFFSSVATVSFSTELVTSSLQNSEGQDGTALTWWDNLVFTQETIVMGGEFIILPKSTQFYGLSLL
jgi:hypothetical protein